MSVIGCSLALVHAKYWRVRDEAGSYRGNVETEADNKCDRVHKKQAISAKYTYHFFMSISFPVWVIQYL